MQKFACYLTQIIVLQSYPVSNPFALRTNPAMQSWQTMRSTRLMAARQHIWQNGRDAERRAYVPNTLLGAQHQCATLCAAPEVHRANNNCTALLVKLPSTPGGLV